MRDNYAPVAIAALLLAFLCMALVNRWIMFVWETANIVDELTAENRALHAAFSNTVKEKGGEPT